MGPSSSVGFSIRHTQTRTHGPKHNKKKATKHNQDTHKPVCTIRSLSGSFGQRGFCFIIQTESHFVFKSRTAVFSPSTRYTSRREQSRTSRWPSFLFRSFRDTQRDTHTHTHTITTCPASRSKDVMDATDHTITSSQPLRRLPTLLPIMGVQGTQKVTGVFPSLCFDFERVFCFCSDGSIDHGMVRGRTSAMKGGTHSKI